MSDSQQFSAGNAFDKAQDYAQENSDQVTGAIDKAQEAISNATGGKFDGAVEKGADMLEDKLGIPDAQAQEQGQGEAQAPDQPQAEAGEQTGSAPQEGTTAPEAPLPGEAPVQPPVQDPGIPSDPSVQPSGEPGTGIPTAPGTQPETQPGYEDGGLQGTSPETAAPTEYGSPEQPESSPEEGQPLG